MKERLFRLGVDPRVVSSANGHTLLHAACGFGASKIAKLVVRRAVYESHPPFRAFLDKRANDGSAALDVATNAGFERIAEWLTALGASSGFRSAFDSGSRAAANYAAARTNATTDPALYPPAFYPPAFAPAHVGVGIPGSHPPLPPSVDAYLFGALESVLGDLEGDESDESDESARLPRDALHNQTRERDDRARARRLVKRVAELAEDRDDYRADLETALRRAERAEAKLAKTRDELRVAEAARAAAASEARGAVARQREEEQRAVLAALGLAERRAVRMAAERETLREERDAIAEALAFVKEETKTLFSNTEQEGFLREASGEAARSSETATETSSRADGNRSGIRDPGSGIEPRGGGWETYRTPNADRATRVTTPRGLRRCWRCPSGTDASRRAAASRGFGNVKVR